jgi:prophage maintenance system killer protein
MNICFYIAVMMDVQLAFEDLVLITAATRDIAAEEAESSISREDAEAALNAPFARSGEIDLYPRLAEKAAICCSRFIGNRPLADGNSKVAYECMREMLVRGGEPWPRPEEDAEEIAMKLNALAEGKIEEAEFVAWVRARVGLGEWLRYRGAAMA